jgi:hypothetical protein
MRKGARQRESLTVNRHKKEKHSNQYLDDVLIEEDVKNVNMLFSGNKEIKNPLIARESVIKQDESQYSRETKVGAAGSRDD